MSCLSSLSWRDDREASACMPRSSAPQSSQHYTTVESVYKCFLFIQRSCTRRGCLLNTGNLNSLNIIDRQQDCALNFYKTSFQRPACKNLSAFLLAEESSDKVNKAIRELSVCNLRLIFSAWAHEEKQVCKLAKGVALISFLPIISLIILADLYWFIYRIESI